jgi:hypothetical protein
VVQHVRPAEKDGYEDTKFIGVYRTEQTAMKAIERLREQPGFCNHPNVYDTDKDYQLAGFCIDDYELDKDHWTEGFGGPDED